jgi:hypothetical protein
MQHQELALVAEAQKQTYNPMLISYEWMTHINSCIGPVITYILKRLIKGDFHFEVTEFFRGV